MSQPMGMTDFFTMEAGEYLERLDALVSPSESPDANEFHRLARALRGSALMANQQTIASVAAGVEALAREVRAGTIIWDESARQLIIRAIDDLKVLVRAVKNWMPAEDARAQRIAQELERVAGAGLPSAPQPRELDSGTRAFIAREGAAVGSALDLAARALARNPVGVDSLEGILRATQPLRGIASLSDLPPLPDLLDGIERAVAALKHRTTPLPNPGDAFDAAARAISRASREIATEGEANPDTPETGEFATHLARIMDLGVDIVTIQSLYHDDAGPHVMSEGTPPGAPPGEVELVSLGEHLKQAAEDLERARFDSQRHLRVLAVAPTLRALTACGPSVARFVNSARAAIGRGFAVSHARGMASVLREAGNVLSGWRGGDEPAIAQRLEPILAALNALGQGGAETPAPAPPAAPPASEALRAVETPPEPIPMSELGVQMATPAPPAAPPTPEPEAPAPPPVTAQPPSAPPVVQRTPTPRAPMATPAGRGGLAASLTTYQELLTQNGAATGTLDELLRGAAVATAPRAGTPPSTPSAPVYPAAPAASGEQVAPITEYCYSGVEALRRALELQQRLSSAAGPEAADIVDEVFDLVKLGLDKSA